MSDKNKGSKDDDDEFMVTGPQSNTIFCITIISGYLTMILLIRNWEGLGRVEVIGRGEVVQ